ncbi:unnamed protein product [Peronospora belbahrii]|nr:unnamed protein product [Peronospora belbahrii]
MQSLSTSTTRSVHEPLLIAEAWSGDTKLLQTLEFARPERALLDIAQGVLCSCTHSVVQWIWRWIHERCRAPAVEENIPRTVRQQLDSITDCLADLKMQQELIDTDLQNLRHKNVWCCNEDGAYLEASRMPLDMDKTLVPIVTQQDLVNKQDEDDYVQLNLQDV